MRCTKLGFDGYLCRAVAIHEMDVLKDEHAARATNAEEARKMLGVQHCAIASTPQDKLGAIGHRQLGTCKAVRRAVSFEEEFEGGASARGERVAHVG